MTVETSDDIGDEVWPAGLDDHQVATAPVADTNPPPRLAFVIDDEAGICEFVSLTLKAIGVEAESFHTVQQATAALDRRQPVLIFLDIQLGTSDAIDVLRVLGRKGYRGIVQLMSGTDPELLEDVRRVGARHGLNMRAPLQKPFRAAAIRQVAASAHLNQRPDKAPDRDIAPIVALDEALAKGWLQLWYQPKIDLRTTTFAGAEGLIRCHHPVHGILAPASFLPGADDASLLALTEYVVITALRDWDEVAEAGVYLHTAVNSTMGALTGQNIPSLIREHRPKNDKWPGLILEVTESEVVKDVPLAHEIATQLRLYGVAFSIDDFGEGYSSFARLRELPFAELKLDRSFVTDCATDPKNAGICRAIIDLAHHFGAVAVAEGLEKMPDLQAVHRMGCDIGQGFLLARPMPKPQLIATLRQGPLQRQAS